MPTQLLVIVIAVRPAPRSGAVGAGGAVAAAGAAAPAAAAAAPTAAPARVALSFRNIPAPAPPTHPSITRQLWYVRHAAVLARTRNKAPPRSRALPRNLNTAALAVAQEKGSLVPSASIQTTHLASWGSADSKRVECPVPVQGERAARGGVATGAGATARGGGAAPARPCAAVPFHVDDVAGCGDGVIFPVAVVVGVGFSGVLGGGSVVVYGGVHGLSDLPCGHACRPVRLLRCCCCCCCCCC